MIAAVGDIDIAVGVGRDRVRRIELARLLAAVAPGFQPAAALVDLGDARIDVAVADEGVAGLSERDDDFTPNSSRSSRREWPGAACRNIHLRAGLLDDGMPSQS
jgi:hypothetical protein